MLKIYEDKIKEVEKILKKKRLTEKELSEVNRTVIALESGIKDTLENYLNLIKKNFNTEAGIEDTLQSIKKLDKLAKKLDRVVNKYC